VPSPRITPALSRCRFGGFLYPHTASSAHCARESVTVRRRRVIGKPKDFAALFSDGGVLERCKRIAPMCLRRGGDPTNSAMEKVEVATESDDIAGCAILSLATLCKRTRMHSATLLTNAPAAIRATRSRCCHHTPPSMSPPTSWHRQSSTARRFESSFSLWRVMSSRRRVP
jgi:hypothetical protein